GEKRHYYPEGMPLDDVAPGMSPEIVQEMFSPGSWDSLSLGDVRLTGVEPVTLDIGPRRRPRQRIEVQGPPWVIARNDLLDKQGRPTLTVTMNDYADVDGVLFPRRVQVEFPDEGATLTVSRIRNIRVNLEMEDALFELEPPEDDASSD
ncbi:MAG TPA: hypothetical protein HPP83_07395, partial [Candidatus Hydrogenedentes bacterium]|nr:hypothetical protein [Candidatus Hydrogenedentota bacterium]